jgi:hypothetical protein
VIETIRAMRPGETSDEFDFLPPWRDDGSRSHGASRRAFVIERAGGDITVKFPEVAAQKARGSSR